MITLVQKRIFNMTVVLAVGAGLAVVFIIDPTRQPLLPPCPLHALTGLHCAGCGTTRALHQLLHGHVAAAFALNPLMMLVLPLLAAHGVRQWIRAQRGEPPAALLEKPLWIWSLAVLILGFSILRNIPLEPFRWLAP